MGIYSIKPRFQKILTPVKDFCVRVGISPTVLNIFGLVASLGIAVCIVLSEEEKVFLVLIAILALVRTACNALDGMVARSKSTASIAGELQNEFLDRLSDSIIFAAFIFVRGISPIVVVAVVAIMLLGSFLGILAKTLIGRRIYNGMMGKADRMLYLGVFAIVVLFVPDWRLWNIFLIFILLGLCETVIARYIVITRESKTKI